MQKSTTTTKPVMFFSVFVCILLLIFPHYSKSFEQFLKSDANSNSVKRSPSSALEFYMKGLFSKYGNKNSKDWPSGADTVRSVEPMYGSNYRYTILFDLNVVGKEERMLNAEIHVNFGRRFWHRNYYGEALKNTRQTRLPLRCWATLSVNGSKNFFDLRLKSLTPLKTAEWWAFDASQIVKAMALSATTSKIQLSIAFEQSSLGKLKTNEDKFLPVHKILRHRQTFFLIFTKVVQKSSVDNNRLLMENVLAKKLGNQTNEKLSKPQTPLLNRAKRYVNATVRQKPLITSENQTSYDRSDYYNYYAYSMPEQRQQLAHQPPAVYEEKALDHVIKTVEKYRTHGPTVLEDAKKMRQKTAKIAAAVDRRLRRQEIDDFGKKAKKQRRQKTTGKTATKEQKKQRQKVSSSTIENSKMKTSSRFSACKKHDLIVEFADIGWGDFIIAPKSFEAHYCAGSCDFPLSKNTNPSNHAIIQSIIHAVGLHPNVPGISCAPDKMDSLSLLYQDPHRNVLMLKNYPKMTVKSCSCL